MQPCYYLLIQSQCGYSQFALRRFASMKMFVEPRIFILHVDLPLGFRKSINGLGCWWSNNSLTSNLLVDALLFFATNTKQAEGYLYLADKPGFGRLCTNALRSNASKWPKDNELSRLALFEQQLKLAAGMVYDIIGHPAPYSTRP